jgi:hypothetical protein
MNVLLDKAKSWLNAGLGLLYPEVCQLCRETRAIPAEGYVCDGAALGRFLTGTEVILLSSQTTTRSSLHLARKADCTATASHVRNRA